eukprot:GHVN01073964.1.p1 GENE.GHVN01073964.1~~GHVN01073964.1.p1  ORF type:complete len:336 (-),score=18.84 GHVN01073964.1:1945-2952(-)
MDCESCLPAVQGILRQRVTAGWEASGEAVQELRSKLCRCALKGENFTLILMGPAGSGKTKTLESSIRLANAETGGALEVVKVDAPMHRDDVSCVKAIVTQLSHLLGCLNPSKANSNFQDNMAFLQMLLKDSWGLSKAVVIVLDHFERFCGQGRQTLLYSLFDLLHVPNLQICVVGLSSVLNVTDNLEKRIKSRCSLQRLYVSGPANVYDVINSVEQLVHISTGDFAKSNLVTPSLIEAAVESFNKLIQTALRDPILMEEWKFEFAAGRDPRWFVQKVLTAVLKLSLSRSSIRAIEASTCSGLTRKTTNPGADSRLSVFQENGDDGTPSRPPRKRR